MDPCPDIGTYTFLFLYLLVILKNVSEVKKNAQTKLSVLTIGIALSGVIAYGVLLLGITLISIVYRQIIYFVLKIKHGTKFIGLLKGSDAFHTIDEPSDCIINILMIVEYDHNKHSEDVSKITRQTVGTFFNRVVKDQPKYHSILSKYGGYPYLIKENVTLNDCFMEMKRVANQEEITRDELFSLLADYYNAPLPKNNTILWNFYGGTQPIKWKENAPKGVKYYPILYRNHHCLTDGINLVKLCIGCFSDKPKFKEFNVCSDDEAHSFNDTTEEQNLIDNLTKKVVAFYKKMLKSITMIVMALYILLMAPSSIFINFYLKARDCNVLHGPPLSGKEVLALNAEDTSEYFDKIKKIKKKIPGTGFPYILLTAFSASLKDYFEEHSCYSDHIATVIPLVSGATELQYLEPGSLKPEDIKFQNTYFPVIFSLPICTDETINTEAPLRNRLKLVQKEINIIKNSVDYPVSYVLIHLIMGNLPEPLLKLLVMGPLHYTVAASIVPGTSQTTLGEGVFRMVDAAFWVPHLRNIGVGFSGFTYGRRLQIGLNADKALIPTQADAQSILSGVYKYLDILEKETET